MQLLAVKANPDSSVTLLSWVFKPINPGAAIVAA